MKFVFPDGSTRKIHDGQLACAILALSPIGTFVRQWTDGGYMCAVRLSPASWVPASCEEMDKTARKGVASISYSIVARL